MGSRFYWLGGIIRSAELHLLLTRRPISTVPIFHSLFRRRKEAIFSQLTAQLNEDNLLLMLKYG